MNPTSFKLTSFELEAISRLIIGIPLEIVHFIIDSIIKKSYCKIWEIEKKIESLTKDVMNMIYIVTVGKNSSFHDLQEEAEEELKDVLLSRISLCLMESQIKRIESAATDPLVSPDTFIRISNKEN